MNNKGNLTSYCVEFVGSLGKKTIRVKSVREKEGACEFLGENSELIALLPHERVVSIVKEEEVFDPSASNAGVREVFKAAIEAGVSQESIQEAIAALTIAAFTEQANNSRMR